MAIFSVLRRQINRLIQARALRQASVVVPAVIIAAVVFMAICANWLMPHDPIEVALRKRLMPPFWLSGGSLDYPLGTDTFGRDILSRIILGSRISLIVSLAVVGLGGIVGTFLGLLAGYFGNWVDAVIMRIVDGIFAFPTVLLAMLLAVALKPSLTNVIVIISLVFWGRFARLVRGEVLSWKTRDFVALARVAGAGPLQIMFRHILPNVLDTAVVMATLQVGYVILLEAALSFLGVGVPPPTPSWGGIVAEGRGFISTAWWLTVFPGLAIMLLVLSCNLLGDWLRDALDPKLRQL